MTVFFGLLHLISGRYFRSQYTQNTDTSTFKNWLILENSTDTDSIPLHNKNQNHKKIFTSKTFGVLSLVLIAYPLLTHANVLQTNPLMNLFSNSKQTFISEVPPRELNSQTAPLLQAATNIDPNPAIGGADLNIIENKALVAESGVGGGFVEITQRKNDIISVYEVKVGDTISQIATMFDVSVNTIKWANGLNRDIQPGDSLVILPISGVKHKVKSGGTIMDIAKLYKADEKEIALFNGISIETQLKEGDEIIVPNVDLVQAEKPKTKTTKSKSVTKTVAKTTTSAPAGGSSWLQKPVSGAIRTQGIHGYNAVDLAASVGTPIVAAADGTVIIAKNDSGWNGGYGNYVVIKHSNGAQTLYAHMSSVSTSVGDSVSQGENIGAVGNTGRSTGAHLHFEVRGAKNPF